MSNFIKLVLKYLQLQIEKIYEWEMFIISKS